MIDFSTLLQRRFNDKAMGIAIFVDLFSRHHNDIHRLADTEHIPVYLSRHTTAVIFAPFDDQQIYITIRSHLSTCCGAKKDNLLPPNRRHNPPHDLLKDLVTHGLLSCFHIALGLPSKAGPFFSSSAIHRKAGAPGDDMVRQGHVTRMKYSIPRSTSHLPVGFKEILNIHLVFLVWI